MDSLDDLERMVGEAEAHWSARQRPGPDYHYWTGYAEGIRRFLDQRPSDLVEYPNDLLAMYEEQ